MQPDIIKRRRALLVCRSHFQHHPILIRLGEDGRDQPLTKGVIERGVHVRRSNAEARRFIAVQLNVRDAPLILQVTHHAIKLGPLLQCRHQFRRLADQIFTVGIIEGELILTRRDLIVDGEILRRLQIEPDARHIGGRLLQLFNHLIRFHITGAKRLQVDLQPPAVKAGVGAVDADRR